jgi:hypothetical protein
VKELLESDPRLRDDDKKLSARIWCNLLGGEKELEAMNAYDFLHLYATGKLTNQESIGRARRLVQEDNPHLRGAKYKERLKEMENVQTELGYKIDLT